LLLLLLLRHTSSRALTTRVPPFSCPLSSLSAFSMVSAVGRSRYPRGRTGRVLQSR
ncbi:uncharacterized protein BDZ99DRAFT_466150, partial [Mytilinidion resinicola]